MLAAVNLRPALSSVGPVLPSIRQQLGLSNALAGLLTAIPTLCFALLAPVGTRLGVRFGLERTVVGGLALTGAASALRWGGDLAPVLLAATVLLGIGTAVTQALLPAIVKERFADRAVLVTGFYALSINLGALLGATFSEPATRAFGSWPASLALWSLLAPLGVAAWLRVGTRPAKHAVVVVHPARLPWRSRTAWALTLYFGGTSVIYIVALTWLAPLYHDHGYSEGHAGLLLSLFTAFQVLSGLVVPPLVQRSGRRRAWLASTLLVLGVGLTGVAATPLSVPWLWVSVMGIGLGVVYPLVLALFVDHARTPEESGRLTAMGFFGGYLLAAASPSAAGALRDLTGTLALAFAILAAIAVVMAVTTLPVRPGR